MVVFEARPRYRGVRAGRADADYISSKSCRACHDGHYDSWARTFHRRMTQEARADSVQGDFERDNEFEYLGVKARMEKRDGAFFMRLAFPDGTHKTFTIDRTVGSRRIEQYLTKQAGQYTRLPLAYDLVNRRWMSLNGSFFYPDGNDFFKHQAQWDANCVFCHNVKAQPNLDLRTRQFNTEVAELGIACGACHGAGATHAERAGSPLARTLWRLSDADEPEIVNPRKLDAERSMMICGHCHGQRVPDPISRIEEIMSRGDPYNAGDDLAAIYRPVTRETKIGDYSFANRFWANGSPRLTAYEYQGVLRSACFTKGDPANRINCLTCHSMHEGDPRGQIKDENRTDKPCLACHKQYEAAGGAHRSHATQRRLYRQPLLQLPYAARRLRHHVRSPDARHNSSRPSVDRRVKRCPMPVINATSINRLTGPSRSRKLSGPGDLRPRRASQDEQFNLPEGPRALFAGDALARALAAEAMAGRPREARPRLGGAISRSKHSRTIIR